MPENEIHVVTTSETGRAALGTIRVSGPEHFKTTAQASGAKGSGERADPHHPESAGFNPDGRPILLTITKGSHTIYVANDGRTEGKITLSEGDQILFMDFNNGKSPNDNLRFLYTGHWSEPGAAGVEMVPAIVHDEVDLTALDYQSYSSS